MLVKDICVTDVATIDADATVQSAAEEMRARNVGTLVVLDDKLQPTGILSDRDIVLRLVANGTAADKTRVVDVMTDSVVSVRESAELDTALSAMTWGMRRVPVVNEQGQLTGLLSLDDVLIAHAKHYSHIQQILEKELPRSSECLTAG